SIFKVLCASALAADDLIILPQKCFSVKYFFRSFSIFSNLWLVFQRIHIGSFALLLPLSEVILYGGPWRSSIIPHPQPSVNTFLHLF
ncbi:hypothetical protein, partial [Faecalibacterium prausnitzii]|uniref:hypothetical protein n=1 Tax=Faecalibacterium prausnitzii TaxID=853 RepID=UPI001A9A5F57